MLERVKTKYGIIEGAKAQIEGVMSFKGVPYAKPPVGELRWRAPEEPEKWTGVLECKEYKPAATKKVKKQEEPKEEVVEDDGGAEQEVIVCLNCGYVNTAPKGKKLRFCVNCAKPLK